MSPVEVLHHAVHNLHSDVHDVDVWDAEMDLTVGQVLHPRENLPLGGHVLVHLYKMDNLKRCLHHNV